MAGGILYKWADASSIKSLLPEAHTGLLAEDGGTEAGKSQPVNANEAAA
jgi:hypothetical protein